MEEQMAFSNLGKLLEIVEEVLDAIPKNSAILSNPGIVQCNINDVKRKICELKQKEEFK